MWLFHRYHERGAATGRRRTWRLRASLHDGWKPNSGRGRDLDHLLSAFIADCRAQHAADGVLVVAPYRTASTRLGRPVDGANYLKRC